VNESRAIVFGALVTFACGGQPDVELAVSPEGVCDVRFAAPSAWCGGALEGEWTYRSACHRPVLEYLVETCPADSFVMHPSLLGGELALTSTSIEAGFAHDIDSLLRIELYEACIEAIGVCPRSHMRELLHWEKETPTECIGYIDRRGLVIHHSGAVHIESNKLIFDVDPSYSGEFCAEGDYLYLNALWPEGSSPAGHYYILERKR
jgi:hypothetical protein